MCLYKYNLFPTPQFKYLKSITYPTLPKPIDPFLIDKVITNYKFGIPLFNDRDYYNHINYKIEDSIFLSTYVIQIPRHYNDIVRIQSNHDLLIYRILTEHNENTEFDDWEKTNIKANIIGNSCSHTRVVKKKFKSGIIELKSGGPVSSTPILIELLNSSTPFPFEIIN
jgi:hypothetical protein